MNASRKDRPADLTVIVPVYNSEGHLPRLIEQVFLLGENGLQIQMICLDDASTDGSLSVVRKLSPYYDGLEILSRATNGGAGLARNAGWERACGRYTIFFDADDIFHGDVVARAISDMDRHPEVDVTVFAYRYEREATETFTEMGFHDRRVFNSILQGKRSAVGTAESMARLLGFTNYPWNKILRTGHFKQRGMRFGSTKVNNDILGHWHSILLARNIIVLDEVNCTHIVHPNGGNLTNDFGSRRLMMLDALEETYNFLEGQPDLRRRFAHHYWALADRLIAWTRPRIDPAFRLQLEARYSELLGRIDLSDLARLRTRHAPELATSLVKHLISGGE